MLKELCEINGISGDEAKVSEYIISHITASDTHYRSLNNGSVIVYKDGKRKAPHTLMLFAHMDEVGFIVSDITKEGFIKFDSIGGIDKRILLSERVYIGENRVPGIIGIKAVHLTSNEEREKCVERKDMYIDIGANSKEEALEQVCYGDYIAFDDDSFINGNRFLSKAIDDRAGVSLLLELVNSEREYGFIACFDVMEEIGGSRGALTAVNLEKPDYALVLEGTTCSDINNTPAHLRSTVLGGGPAVSVRDMLACYSSEFNSYIFGLAEKNNIRYQIKQTHRGGNDAGAVQSGGKGTKTSAISLPVRYIHSPVGIVDMNDYESALKLAGLIIDNIGEI